MRENHRPIVGKHEKLNFDYTNAGDLRRFLTATGKIRPRKITGLGAKSQRELTLAVKHARFMGLLPYVIRPKTVFH